MRNLLVKNHLKSMRIKLLLFTLSIMFLVSCDENSRADCATVLCAAQSLSIELVNAEGTNLIANETYSLENIVVSKEDIQVNESGNNMGQTIIIIIIISGTEGDNVYQVVLNDSETDTLVLDLQKNSPGSECCSPPFTIKKATYNGAELEIIRPESQMEKIVVVK